MYLFLFLQRVVLRLYLCCNMCAVYILLLWQMKMRVFYVAPPRTLRRVVMCPSEIGCLSRCTTRWGCWGDCSNLVPSLFASSVSVQQSNRIIWLPRIIDCEGLRLDSSDIRQLFPISRTRGRKGKTLTLHRENKGGGRRSVEETKETLWVQEYHEGRNPEGLKDGSKEDLRLSGGSQWMIHCCDGEDCSLSYKICLLTVET